MADKTKKTLNFVLQSKGGVGKSFMIYLIAKAYQTEENTIYIDLDNSTQTTKNRLENIVGDKRLSYYSILDNEKKIEREQFLNMLEDFSNIESNKLFLDFGAPESEEFLKLLIHEYSGQELREACEELGININFIVILTGNDTLASCLKYANDISMVTKEYFNVYWLLNLGLAGDSMNRQNAIDSTELFLRASNYTNTTFDTFGDLGHSQSSKDIITMIATNSTPENLNFAGREKYRKMMDAFKIKLETWKV